MLRTQLAAPRHLDRAVQVICLLALIALVAFTRPAAATPAAPPQPTALAAFHRSGQTFLTWTERADLAGERYRVYRHTRPIDADSLPFAQLLYEVPEGSSIFFASRYADYAQPPNWRYRYGERLWIADGGPALPAGAGLLVWTVDATDLSRANPAYYAVTTVVAGAENRADFGAGNTTGPVTEAVARPAPVRLDGPGGWRVYLQYRDLRNWNPTFHAPNPLNNYYGLDANDEGVPGALQYAYDTAVHAPDPAACGGKLPDRLPLLLSLHGWGGNTYGPPGSAPNWCGYIVAPVDQSETWWFGFARDHDYRTGGAPKAGDAIVNYTEQRVLDLLAYLLDAPPGPPVDPQRIYVSGHSMGGGGAVGFAMRYGNVFAAANASKAVTNHRNSGQEWSTLSRWGAFELNLPVEIAAPNGWADPLAPFEGMGVWDWQNWQADLTRRPSETRAPLQADFGINDTAVPWSTQGAPMLERLEASRQPWAAVVAADGHAWGDYAGLGPNYRRDAAGAPFGGFSARRDETVPAFSRVATDGPVPPTAPAAYRQSLFWSASWTPWDSLPVDTRYRWRMSICAVAVLPDAAPKCGTGVATTADVTLRRLQRFAITPRAEYRWEARAVEGGALLSSGALRTGADGILTVPQVRILAAGTRLTVQAIEKVNNTYLPATGRGSRAN